MQITLLLVVIVVLATGDMPSLVFSPGVAVAAVVAYLAGAAAIASLRGHLAWRLRANPRALDRVLRRARHLWALGNVWMVGGTAGLMACGLGQALRQVPRAEDSQLAFAVLATAPFMAAMVLSWLLDYPLHRQVRLQLGATDARAALWTRAQYVAYNFRHGVLMLAAPLGVMLLAQDLVSSYGRQWLVAQGLTATQTQWALDAACGVAALVVFVAAPAMVVRVWRTASLPAGELRQSLEAVLATVGARCRDILVWQTGRVIINACAMGLLAPVRYVLLSDALLERLPAPCVRAVFAHEAGHIRAHHIFYLLLLAPGITVPALAAADLIQRLLPASWATAGQALALAPLAAAWYWGFGFVSRRFERHSDVIAAWSCGPSGSAGDGRIAPEGAAIFAQALAGVAELSGVSPTQRNWRHGSIRQRINFIIFLGSTGATRRAVDQSVSRIKAVIWLLAAVAAALAAWMIWQG